MKYLPTIASVLLGLIFLIASVPFLLGKIPPQPAPPAGSAMEAFNNAFGPTGYLTFVKVCELLGAILVLIPKTRNFGLLVLTPIVVNIVAFSAFIAGGGMGNPLLIGAEVLIVYLFIAERRAFLGLIRGRNQSAG
jgi:hypothetical protein